MDSYLEGPGDLINMGLMGLELNFRLGGSEFRVRGYYSINVGS